MFLILLLAICSLSNFVRGVCSLIELPRSNTCCPECVERGYRERKQQNSREGKINLRVSELIASNVKLIVMTLISFRWYIQLKNVAETGTSVMSFLCLISNDVYADSKM